jgi:K+-transporting ATPase A subunit
VLALRNFLIIPVLPALLAWVLAGKLKYKPWIVFSIVYILFITLFFTARFIHPRLNFPEEVVSRQEAFLKLGGGSAVAVDKMEPTFVSFVFNSPQAFTLSTIRPYPSDVRHLLSLAAAAEINFLLLLFIAFLIWRRKGTGWSPFLLFCIFFSFSILMMIGYTVDVLGAIVRYRSVVLTLLVVPMIAQIDWSKINRLFLGNIINK